MKVMQINCVYRVGSTGKLVLYIHQGLKNKGYQSIVCYGRGKILKEEGVYKTSSELYSKVNNLISKITGMAYGGCYYSTKKLIKIIKRENPDVLHLHCINGYFVNIYKLIEWLKDNNISTVLTLHAEFMFTANCSHSFGCDKWLYGCGKCNCLKDATGSFLLDKTAKSYEKMKAAFDNYNENLVVVSVSNWLMNRAKIAPILRDKKHMCVFNGVDDSIFKYNKINNIKNEFCENKEKMILHVTPYFSNQKNDVKGGEWIIRLAEKLKDDDYKIVVVGENRIKSEMPSNLIMLGRIDDQNKLAQLYSGADVTLITSRRETFSMIVAESLCCGTPVIGFNAGAPEEIAIKEYCRFVECGDLDGLLDVLENIVANEFDKKEIAERAIIKFGSNNMVNNYMKIYNQLVDLKENLGGSKKGI